MSNIKQRKEKNERSISMRKVIVFTGDDDIEIGLDYFFQHEAIKSLSPEGIFTLWQSTRVYEQTLKLTIELDNKGTIDLKTGQAIEPDYLDNLIKGREILEQAVRDLWPKDVAEYLMNEVEKLIKDEVTESKFEEDES